MGVRDGYGRVCVLFARGSGDVGIKMVYNVYNALGRKLRILTIVDTNSRYCPATGVRFRYRGEDVVRTLERICTRVSYMLDHRLARSAFVLGWVRREVSSLARSSASKRSFVR